MNKLFFRYSPLFIVLLCLVIPAISLHATTPDKILESSEETKTPSISEERLNQIMTEGKKAMTNGKYRRAVQLFNKVLGYPDHEYRQEALELLGLARERNGQLPHAKAEYKEYLRLYPDGEGADRVRQRLDAITTQKPTPKRDTAGEAIKLKESDSGAEDLSMSEERLKQIMEEGKKALTGGEYRRAIQLYSKVLRYPDHKYRQEAQELLGFARERNGQLYHAQAEYKEYLHLYPEGEGADRVRQRLAGLETAWAKPREKLRKAKKKQDTTRFYGSFSQYYDRVDRYSDLWGDHHDRSSLTSNLNLNFRHSGDAYDIGAVAIGGYERDFINVSENETRLSRLYFDVLHRKKQLSMRLGRQQSSTGGVLGRFDGGIFSYSLGEYVKANLVSGFPVDSSKIKDPYDTNTYFYGLNFDIGTFADSWDFNVFVIDQIADRFSDRRAAGGEVRYSHIKRSLFSYFDYDYSYKELNTFLFLGNLTLPYETLLNLSVDYRKSPPLTTSNAIIGQGVDSLDDLRHLGKSKLRRLARDRTATSKSLLFGITQPIGEKLQISGDFTVSEVEATKSSGGVEAIPATGNEYFYNTQIIGNNLIVEGDIVSLGYRHSDTSTSATHSIIFNTRYPCTRDFRINPKTRVDLRKNTRKHEDRLKIRPSLRLEYRWKKMVWFEVDGGVEWDRNRDDATDSTTSYFVTAGYRIEF